MYYNIIERGDIMEIKWLSKKNKDTVTIYETNLTLNTNASNHFKDSVCAAVGYTEDNDQLIIKSLNDEDIKSGEYDEDNFHQITIKASYGRINGTDLIKNLTSFHKLDFKTKANHKFKGFWDNASKSLIIDLKEEIE